tara:strand:- start:75 stop:524 length:450 start_codon:yes stop_codon:yes gene_type:complete
MASINKVFLIGNLGKDPELRHTSGGGAVCNFTIATTETWNSKNGERQERTEWHRIVVWNKQGENCAQYLKKGRLCHVEGRIQTRDWEDKEGNTRYTTEIVADRVTFLGGRDDVDRRAAVHEDKYSTPSPGRTAEMFDNSKSLSDDDIPF